VGRLATYRYYNMDQVVGMALKEAENIAALPAVRQESSVEDRGLGKSHADTVTAA
jgi:hypothetical protein